MSRWHNIKFNKKLIGDPVANDFGRAYCFVSLPKNNSFPEGYGFLISDTLITEEGILLSDDYNVELKMNPTLREGNKRYKRFKLDGKELMETILFPYITELEAELKAEEERKEAERNKRNQKTLGRVVYGKYLGNRYGEEADTSYDFYFVRNGVYYNGQGKHEKVENVKVDFVVANNASKFDYEQNVGVLRECMKDYNRFERAVSELTAVKEPPECLSSIICQLDSCKRSIIEKLQSMFTSCEQ